MGRLENEARTAMTVLLKVGHTQSAVARLLGVTEGSVRYHRRRRESGATDGRSRQVRVAAVHVKRHQELDPLRRWELDLLRFHTGSGFVGAAPAFCRRPERRF